MKTRGFTTAAALGLAVVASGCRGPAEPGPEGVALDLFELARVEEPSDADVEEMFDVGRSLKARAALLDALAGLAEASSVEVLRVQTADDDEAFADVVGTLPGGGEAIFSVRLRSTAPGEWIVTWFQGPGTEWPTSSDRSGAGLTTSTPP